MLLPKFKQSRPISSCLRVQVFSFGLLIIGTYCIAVIHQSTDLDYELILAAFSPFFFFCTLWLGISTFLLLEQFWLSLGIYYVLGIKGSPIRGFFDRLFI